MPSTGSNGGAPLFCAQWICSTWPLAGEVGGRDREVARAALLQRVRDAELHRPERPRRDVVGARAGGSPISSIWVTEAAPSRWAFATQSAPVSPPPITITCLPGGADRASPAGSGAPAAGPLAGDEAVALVEVVHREVHAVRARGPGTGRSRGTRAPVAITTAS